VSAYDWDDPTETTPAATVLPIRRGKTTQYGRKALDDELGVLAATPEGGRNDQLNRSAFNIAQLVNAGHVDADEASTALEHTARMIGLTATETVATIRSAGGGATTKPRLVVPEPDAPTPVPPVTVITERVEEPEDGLQAFIDQTFPVIDWHELWGREDDELDWIIEPLLPARRLVAMYSPPKVGKSLLMLEIAAAVATGRKVLGGETQQCRVLYVDFENDPVQDTRTRLMQMGYGPDEITGRLFMLSFPTLAALDSAQGAQELLAVAERHQVQAIIVDTVSRAVKGEENDNDTWLAFYRHTGLRLKQAGIALMRLDHAGKDITKGQRGGSAKVGDVDAVWRLDRISEAGGETTLTLKCEAQRFPFQETDLTLKRRGFPLRHDVEANPRRAAFEAKVADCAKALDAADVPRTISERKAREALKSHGWRGGNDVLRRALQSRGGTVLEEDS
jgi:hypothetical protein